ncbi:MAG: GNAT family N-acetyltransferase [Gammaproteobacteria bacterium]
MAESLGSSIFRPTFLIMSGRAIGFVVTFGMPIILVRIFSQAEFGTYKQIFLIFGTLLLLGPIGMGQSLYYFLPSTERRGGGYVANALGVLALAGLVLLVFLWLDAGRIADWLNNPQLAAYMPYLGVFLFMMMMSTVLEISMIARKQHRLAFGTYAVSDTVRAALFLLPVLVFHSLTALMVGAIAFAALRLVATALYLWKQYGSALAFDRVTWKPHLAYALPFALAVVVQVVQGRLGMYFVSNRFDAATFAIFAVGCLQIPLTDILITSTSNVMMVRMKETLNENRPSETLEIWWETTRKLALIFAGLGVMLIVSAHAIIVTLYTPAYARSVPIFEVASIGVVFAPFLTRSIMRVYAQMRFVVVLKIVKLGVLCGTIFFLMNWLGLIGAVFAGLAAEAAGLLLGAWRGKNVMRCSVAAFLPWRSLFGTWGIAVVAALPALAMRMYVDVPVVAKLFIIPTVYTGVYIALTWYYGPMRQSEKAEIIRMLRRAVRYLPHFGDELKPGFAVTAAAGLPGGGTHSTARPAIERSRGSFRSSALPRLDGRMLRRLFFPIRRQLWYALDISGPSTASFAPSSGIEVLRCDSDSVAAVPRSIRTGALRSLRRLMHGEAQLWIARTGETAMASVWVFRGRTPAVAAPGGWLSLPPGHACLQDAVTAAQCRGRGIAPDLWVRVAGKLASEGVETVLLQIDERNRPAIRAAEKAGFRPLATMEWERGWLRSRVRLSGRNGMKAPGFLLEQLAR